MVNIKAVPQMADLMVNLITISNSDAFFLNCKAVDRALD